MPERKLPSERKSIWVYIKLDGEGFASPPEFDLRYELEDAIEEHEIGSLEGAGSGGGWMDVSFGVENIQAVDRAIMVLKNWFTEYKVPDELVRLVIVSQDDNEQICDALPEFQLGDCLSYRFEDGNFGAALILKQRNDSSYGEETLLGIMDYKYQSPPPAEIFERRQWLIGSHESRRGKPYLVWVHCFGGIDVAVVHHDSLQEHDPKDCNFHLSWEMVPEYFVRDKYRGNLELNQYEMAYKLKGENRPNFQPGDCLSYRFEDRDFGAALVLKVSDDDSHRDEILLGILDYKEPNSPPRSVFEVRKWLVTNQEWRKGERYLVWASYCWSDDCHGIEATVVDKIEYKDSDPMSCLVGLYWEDIPEFVLYEKYGEKK